jgi:hypothetical protein
MDRRKWLSASVALFGLGFSLALAGCVIAPDQRHFVDGVVMLAPPAPRVEVIGEPPTTGYVWLGGYWNWIGGRYEWTAGHWGPSHPGHHWVAYQWVRQGDGWRMKPGHWERG